MKKMMKYFAAAFVAIVAVSCVKEMDNSGQQAAPKMVKVTFGVDLDENTTKTSLGEVDGAPALLWSAGDKIAVLDSLYKGKYEFTLVSGAGTTSASFTGTVPEDALNAEKNGWCFVYPYEYVESYYKFDDRHNINILSSVEQKATLNSFAPKSNITIGHSCDIYAGATMYNVSGYLKLTLQGTGITSVTVFDNNNNTEAGSLRVGVVPSPKTSSSYTNGRTSDKQSNKVVLIPSSGESQIASGTYYLTYRPGSSFAEGMTLKFTNSDGRVAFYSSNDDADGNLVGKNKTVDLGTWDASALNWKSKEEIVIDFTDGNQPFTTDLPTETAGVSANYSIADCSLDCYVHVTEGSDVTLNNKGLWANTVGDYIEFPAIMGKRLKEVILHTNGGFVGTLKDADGNDVGGKSVRLYSGNTYSYIMRDADLNTKYRLVVDNVLKADGTVSTSASSYSKRLTKITLVYYGEDFTEISEVTASATNSFTGFTVTGEVQGIGLDAATWGIQYGTVVGEWTNEITGNGGKINKLVEVPAGTYYVRTWASEDGGQTKKVYSDPVAVTVKAFSGKIVFDFARDAADANLSFVGTSDASAAAFVDVHLNRKITGEDYWTYSYDGVDYPFTMYGMWDSENNTRKQWTYCLSYAHNTGLYGVLASSSNKNYWMSIPMIDGYRLVTVNVWAHSSGRTLYVTTTANSTTGIGTCTSDGTLADSMYMHTADVSSKSEAGVQYYIYMGTNSVHPKYEFVYEQVN